MVHPCLIACQKSGFYRDVIFKLVIGKIGQCINIPGVCAQEL